MKGISLFSGVGGFEIGFERAGIETVLQAESDPWCLQVLARHWPEVTRVVDVRKVDQAALRGRCGDVVGVGVGSNAQWLEAARGRGIDAAGIDLVYGGWPCQGNSVAGKRAGLSDERSGLWHEVRRVLSELRPRWFVGENVPGLLSVNRGVDFLRVLMDLDELGYGVAWRTLDARWFGVPQRRRRVFVVGCLGDAPRAAQVLAVCESCGGHPAPSSQTREAVAASLRSRSSSAGVNMPGRGGEDDANLIVAGTLEASYGRLQGASGQDASHNHDTLVVANGLRASDGHHGYSSPRGDGADNPIAFSNRGNETAGAERLRAGSHGAMPMVGGTQGVRRLTPLECERLMGFPDDWTRYAADGTEISDSHRYKMCGNGVVATVAEWLGWRLMAADRLAVERAA